MIDPEKRAEMLRPKMMKGGKFLIARIKGSGQEKDPEKVIGNFFRWKQYIGHHTPYEEEWLTDSLKNIWSSKYMGLSKDFWLKPVEQVKKLEFQNPAYSGAYAFNGRKGDPRNYRRVFAIQLSGCTYGCNYCYVPPKINLADPKLGRYFSPEEIINNFLLIRKKSEIPINVLRITGGEATTIVPEIIIDVYSELEKRGKDYVYLWIDTNLSTTRFLEKVENDLKSVMKKRNVGIVGCFKGVSKEDFSLITGVAPQFYKNQFETAKMFLDFGSDFYVYLPALVYENDIEQKIENFVERLQNLNKNLPLRLIAEVLIIKGYTGALKNMKLRAKEGRPMPKVDQRKFFDIWFNKILPKYYPQEMLNKFSCEISL